MGAGVQLVLRLGVHEAWGPVHPWQSLGRGLSLPFQRLQGLASHEDLGVQAAFSSLHCADCSFLRVTWVA